MKTIFMLLLTAISYNTFASWETVTGNGNLKKETRKASAYTGIELQGSMDVLIAYGSTNSITVEADENLLPYIETEVENGILKIRQKKGVGLKSKNKLTVHASLTQLTNIALSGSGNVRGNGAFSNNGKTMVKLSGSGNIGLGVADINLLDVAISGSGNINIKGNQSNNIAVAISGSGNLDCSNLPTNDVYARVSGSGNIKVNASKSIDAKVSGSGNIYYKGTASNLSMKASGSGKIIKV